MTSTDAASNAATLQANHATVERFIEATNALDDAALGALVAPDFVDHDPMPGQPPGIDGLRAQLHALAAAFPDLRFTLEDAVAEDDLVVARGVLTGTNSGSFMGIPPTGRPMRWTATRMLRIRDGVVTEGWINLDMVGMLVQMGVVPPPPG